jgi:hypothetical protein
VRKKERREEEEEEKEERRREMFANDLLVNQLFTNELVMIN